MSIAPSSKYSSSVISKILSLSGITLPKAGLAIEDGEFGGLEVNAGEVSFQDVQANHSLKKHLSENIEHLIDFLDSYRGNQEELAERLYEEMDTYNINLQKNIIDRTDFLRNFSPICFLGKFYN